MATISHFLLGSGIASGIVAILGVTLQSTIGDASVPWDKIGSVGIAGAVVGVGGYFLRRESAIRKELAEQHEAQLKNRDEVNKEIAARFGETATSLTKTYADSTLAHEQRSQEREKRLHELLDRLTKDRA